MTIQVELIDGTYCRLVPKGLDLLLSRKLVKRFRRSSGWAVIGEDPIRESPQANRLCRTGPKENNLSLARTQCHETVALLYASVFFILRQTISQKNPLRH